MASYANTMAAPTMGVAPEYSEALASQLGLQNKASQKNQRQQLLDSLSSFSGAGASGALQSGLRDVARSGADSLAQGQQGLALQGAQALREDRQSQQARDFQSQQNDLNRALQKWQTQAGLDWENFQFGTNRDDFKENRLINTLHSLGGGLASGAGSAMAGMGK